MASGNVSLDGPAPGEDEASATAAAKIQDEVVQIRKVQEWWSSEPDGPAIAFARSPVLAALERPVLAEVIASDGGYHLVLTADRLDGLHRQYGSSTDPSLEPLRKALQARGGAKAQARAVGMLLFKEARGLLDLVGKDPAAAAQAAIAAVASPARAAAASAPPAASGSPAVAGPGAAVKLDQVFAPPRKYVRSEAYPAGAVMAARASPSAQAEIVAMLPCDFAYVVSGTVGEYLEVQVEAKSGGLCKAYVPPMHQGQAMLVPATVLEEVFSSTQRWVRAGGYPAGATMAVKAEPSWESKQIAALPPDFDQYFATGRSGDFLEVTLDIDGVNASVYVLHRLRDLVLLEPAPAPPPLPTMSSAASNAAATMSPAPAPAPAMAALSAPSAEMRASEAVAAARAAADAAERAAAAARAVSDVRVEALEARVSMQDQQIRALQSELGKLRAQLTSAASALATASGASG